MVAATLSSNGKFEICMKGVKVQQTDSIKYVGVIV